MNITIFDDAWFHGIIEQNSPESKSPVQATDAQSRCLLVAASIIAQAIDNLAEKIKQHGKDTAP